MEQLSNYTTPANTLDINPIDKLLFEQGSMYVANTYCCAIVIAHRIIQYLVFGELRSIEDQHFKETFLDYFLHKSFFVCFILDAKTYDERSPWAIWFTLLGSILLLSKLCTLRFEYLSLSPTTKKWPLIKITILITALFMVTTFCNGLVTLKNFSTNILFLLAETTYVLTFVISVLVKFAILTYDMRTNSVWENRATIIYYSDLLFATSMLTIDLMNRLHLLITSQTSYIIKVWCMVKMHTLYMEICRRHKRHKNYLLVIQLMESNFSMASKEDIDNNSDDCAICWDEMETARKLPCGHLFHNSCLQSWLEQDTSCPICRTALKRSQDGIDDGEDTSDVDEEFTDTNRLHQRNPFLSFESSRYTNNPLLSWMPAISFEGFIN